MSEGYGDSVNVLKVSSRASVRGGGHNKNKNSETETSKQGLGNWKTGIFKVNKDNHQKTRVKTYKSINKNKGLTEKVTQYTMKTLQRTH